MINILKSSFPKCFAKSKLKKWAIPDYFQAPSSIASHSSMSINDFVNALRSKKLAILSLKKVKSLLRMSLKKNERCSKQMTKFFLPLPNPNLLLVPPSSLVLPRHQFNPIALSRLHPSKKLQRFLPKQPWRARLTTLLDLKKMLFLVT